MPLREKVLISACLLGERCRYDGGHNRIDQLIDWQEDYDFLPFCPEVAGGLPTPREAVEISEGKFLTKSGENFTSAFVKGAQAMRELAHREGVQRAILKARSPSCGVGTIYDGSHQRRLTSGDGLAAQLLSQSGLILYTEEELPSFREDSRSLREEKDDDPSLKAGL